MEGSLATTMVDPELHVVMWLTYRGCQINQSTQEDSFSWSDFAVKFVASEHPRPSW